MELLCSRINQLNSFINDNGMQAPLMDTNNHAILLKVFSHQRLPYDILSKDLRPSKDRLSKPSPVANSDQVAEQQTVQQQQQLLQPQNGPGILNVVQGDTTDLMTILSNSPTSLNAMNVPNVGWEDMPNHTGWGDVQPDFLTYMDELQPMPPHEINIDSFTQIHATPGGPQGPDGLDAQQDDAYDSDGDSINTEALTNQLSERIGSLHIGPVGHIRFLGPTSYFSLIKTPRTEQPTGWQQRPVQNTQDYLTRIGLGKMVPAGLEEHLTNLYFAWQDPSLHVVSRPMYESARARKCNGEETPYYSESLRNAICALGAAFETRHHASIVTFPRSLAEFFAERAKSLLDAELDCPSVATVQALVVLSSHEIGSNKDSRGWLFCGMAMRLALDLGLHMNPKLHVLRGNLTQEEADLRADVFWGAYLSDQ
ncbi:unnamed protein product [Clonostachys chloroleuca]|uniref:Xylanolytic transcriptional activator regulatory domain-containing protein n=1 Tax=Clonostachys chloroleuca TaxID=1926264 RepID=A0AA35Q630_9HYPO|nr:unnamed protein product [Clonostachys chloroleuca]